MHKAHLIIDLQYGSTGKGLLAGYLAKREDYDTAVCAFGVNAGHSYFDRHRDLSVMTQQLPTSITSKTVKYVMLGPGSLIHPATLQAELNRFGHLMDGKTLLIHPQAAIVEDYHAQREADAGMSKIGSTTKGVGAAMVERIERQPDANVAKFRLARHGLDQYVTTEQNWMAVLAQSDSIVIEGAQGFGLSIYHGAYPYTTSRDVTPWQIMADCGLPFRWASSVQIKGTLRTFPIRVNNRDGTSGPGFPDQMELPWTALGVEPELTTVTKLQRRIFTFSQQQLQQAIWHCGHYWSTDLFLNFVNYMKPEEACRLITDIETTRWPNYNPPKVKWLGLGPDDSDVYTRSEWDAYQTDSEGGEE